MYVCTIPLLILWLIVENIATYVRTYIYFSMDEIVINQTQRTYYVWFV